MIHTLLTDCYTKIIKFLKGIYTLFSFLGKFPYSFDSKPRENIQQMNWKDDHIYSIEPSFCWGDNFQSQILKRVGIRNKISARGVVKSSCHRYFPAKAYYVPCQERLCEIKYGFEGSISNVDLALC